MSRKVTDLRTIFINNLCTEEQKYTSSETGQTQCILFYQPSPNGGGGVRRSHVQHLSLELNFWRRVRTPHNVYNILVGIGTCAHRHSPVCLRRW